MKTYRAYLKDGQTFIFQAEGFEVEHYAGYYIKFLKGEAQDESRYINYANLAAIIPVEEVTAETVIHVHLKSGKSFTVNADHFKRSDPRVSFYDAANKHLPDIFVASSEAMGIFPEEGVNTTAS